MVDVAALGLSVDSSGVVRSVNDLKDFKHAAKEAQDAGTQMAAGITKASNDTEAAARRLKSAYESARAAIDPLFNASMKYAGSLSALTAAEQAGIITKNDLARLNTMAATKYLESGRAAQMAADAEKRAAVAAKEVAAAKKIAAQEAADAERKALQAAKEAAQAQAAAAKQVEQATKAYASLRSGMDPLFAASQQYERGLQTLTAALNANIISQREFDRQASALAQATLSVGTAAATASTATSDAAREQARIAQEYENTRRVIDPLYAATQRYEQIVRSLTAAKNAGLITESDYWLQHQKATDAHKNGLAVTEAAEKSYNKLAYAATNASFQFQDFFVQVASGQSVMVAFAQQAPQLLGAFGSSGKLALIGSLAGTAVAALALFLPMLSKTGTSAKDAEKQLEGLERAVSDYTERAKEAALSSADLAVSFGSFGDARGEFSRFMADFQKISIGDSISKQLDDLTTKFGGLSTTKNIADPFANIMSPALKEIEGTWLDIRTAMKLTDVQTNAVVSSLYKLNNAGTLEEQVEAARSFKDSMFAAFGSIDKMPKQMQAMVASSIQLAELASDTAKNWDQVAQDNANNDMFEQMVERANAAIELQREADARRDEGLNAYYETMVERATMAMDLQREADTERMNGLDAVYARMVETANYNIETANAAAEAEQAKTEATAEYVAEQERAVALAEAIRMYGEESAEVEALKRDAAMATAEAYIEQNGLLADNADQVRDAAAASYDAQSATDAWAAAMARVNAEIQAITRSLAAISGFQIQAAAAKVEQTAIERGTSLADAARLGQQAERNAQYSARRSEIISQYTGDYDNPSYRTAIRLLNDEEAAAKAAADAQIDLGRAREAGRAKEAAAEKAARGSAGGSGGGRKGGGRSDSEKEADKAQREAERDAARLERDRERAAKRIYEQTRTQQELMADAQIELNELYEEGYFGDKGSVAALDTYARAMRQVQDEYNPLTKATKEWVDTLKDGILDSITGAENLSEAVNNVGKAIERALWQATLFGEGPFAELFGGGSGLLGGIASSITDAFGGGITPNAKGGVYQSAGLSNYSNSVVAKPTLFAFAKGAGLMGEAGPEAIMPLSRGPDGRLGVRAAGGAGSYGGNARVELIVTAEEGDMFKPRVEAIATDKSVEVTNTAMGEMNDRLPGRIMETLNDDRVR